MSGNLDFNNLKEQVTDPQDVSDMFTPEDIEQNKILAAIATVPLLFWVPIAFNSASGYGKFYANQGLLFTLLNIVLQLAGGILGGLFGLLLGWIPVLGGIIAGIFPVAASICGLAAWIFLLVYSLQGKAVKLPIVGDLFTVFN